MCGSSIKRTLLLLLLPLLLALSQGTCLAAEEPLTMTQSEAQQFQDSFERKLQIISDLQLKMRNSNELIRNLEEQLKSERQKALNSELNWKRARELQQQQQLIIDTLKQDYRKQETLLTQTLAEFSRYVKEHREKRSSVGAYGSTSSYGIFFTHDWMMVFGGKKWDGGTEIGGGVQIRF